MNNIFNIQRVERLSRWIIATDMPYYRRTAATTLAIILFILLIPTLHNFFGGDGSSVRDFPAAVMLFMLAAVFLLGGSYMMYSYSQRKEGLRELNLLPASNQEKFLMRYLLSFLSQLVICIGCILIADLVQYVVGWIIGRAEPNFFIPVMFDVLGRFDNIPGPMVWCLFTQFLWVHTFYIVGANFFRNIKFSWLFTSIILFVLFLAGIRLLSYFVGSGRQVTLYMEDHIWPFSFLFLALSIFHVWLAYRLFCRRQLVGRFFNC
ncbi:MAG: hypothetical protein J6Y97_05005 [Prevotella sp.]|nr:hypothetical protein [Prevotella sp.]